MGGGSTRGDAFSEGGKELRCRLAAMGIGGRERVLRWMSASTLRPMFCTVFETTARGGGDEGGDDG